MDKLPDSVSLSVIFNARGCRGGACPQPSGKQSVPTSRKNQIPVLYSLNNNKNEWYILWILWHRSTRHNVFLGGFVIAITLISEGGSGAVRTINFAHFVDELERTLR
jgi:hypothetical protein